MKNKSWSHAEDLLLVEVVLNFTSKGAGLSEAFHAASEKLPGRTSKACYSRWKSYLKHLYADAIHEAVNKQKEYASQVVSTTINKQIEAHINEDNIMLLEDDNPSISFSCKESEQRNENTFEETLHFLNEMNSEWLQLKEENNYLSNELEKAWNESEKLKMQLIDHQSNYMKWDKLNQLADKLESVSL